jgi:RNA polymerase sigma-70 factor (ECF subfamily)
MKVERARGALRHGVPSRNRAETARVPPEPAVAIGNFHAPRTCHSNENVTVTQAATSIAAVPSVRTDADSGVLAGCCAGDPVALRSFVLQNQGAVFAFLSRTLGRGPHVEDLAQEVFLRAVRALPRFDRNGRATPRTWLLTIASRLVIDYRRKRRLPVQTMDHFEVPATGTPETEARRAEIGRALSHAAAQLSDDHRDVFVLAEFHGLDMREIATVLGIREATVKTRLFRARERLRTLLGGIGEEP